MKFLVVMFALVAVASCSPVGTFDLSVQKLTRPAPIPEVEVAVLPNLPIIASPLPLFPETPIAPIQVLPGDNIQVGTFPAPIPEDTAAVSITSQSSPLVQIILNIISDRTPEDLVETIQAPSGITKPVGEAPIDITQPILELPVEAPSGITKPVGEAPLDITKPILEIPVKLPAFARPANQLPAISRPASDLIR